MRAHQIVVGADGTAESEAALLWAAAEAAEARGRLVIVHAWGGHLGHRAPYAPYSPHADLAFEQECAAAALDRAAAFVRDRHPGVPVEPRLAQGRPESVLPQHAQGADLLVLGSAARRDDGGLGAVVRSCLSGPPCPVVVVPATDLSAPRTLAELARAR
ncbi:universal stress protein [Nonomuraea terrae]|nr:universal stress protein [Nonomuraea terrae]